MKPLKLSEPQAFDLSKVQISEPTRAAETVTRLKALKPKSLQEGRGSLGSDGTENLDPKQSLKRLAFSWLVAASCHLSLEVEQGGQSFRQFDGFQK